MQLSRLSFSMRFDKPKKNDERPQYLLSYCRKGVWIDTPPLYSRKVTKRDEAFYAVLYGDHNVKVEVVDKMGRRRRTEQVERPEYGEGYEE